MLRGCGSPLVGLRCWGASASADAVLATDAGTFLAFGGQDVAVVGACVAPVRVGVQGPGLHGVVGMVGVGDGELPQRPEVASIG